MADERESRWVLRAQAGDREALELLLEALSHPLRGYLRKLAPAHADDLLQDVLFIVARKLGYLRDPELLRPWVFRTASREAFRHLKRERSRGTVEDVDVLERTAASLDPPLGLADEAAALLERVPPAARAALVLHYLHELTLADVASVLEVPVGTVKSRINYGLTLLRGRTARPEVTP